MEYRLLEKREMWIKPVILKGVDLDSCAAVVADVLGLSAKDVMVTDAMEDRLVFDILCPTIDPRVIAGKEQDLIRALGRIKGVEVLAHTSVHSEGVLGLIHCSEEEALRLIDASQRVAKEVEGRIRRRAVVFPTGRELMEGQIEDKNTPFLLEGLRGNGFEAKAGPVLPDSAAQIARAIALAAQSGYGLVLTTGGIGAEGKDQTLDGLRRLDPAALTPCVMAFKAGEGRHQRAGVCLGVGRYGTTRIVCLPGPHDEVILLWPLLQEGILQRWQDERLARALALRLRQKFLLKAQNHQEGRSFESEQGRSAEGGKGVDGGIGQTGPH